MLEGGPRGCTTYLADTQPYSCLIPSARNDANSAFREGDSGVTHHEHSQIQLLRMSFWKSKSSGGHRGFVLYSSVRPAAHPAQEWVGEPGGWWDTAEYLGTITDPFLDMPASWHACGGLNENTEKLGNGASHVASDLCPLCLIRWDSWLCCYPSMDFV